MPATSAKDEAIHLYRHRADHAIGGYKLPFAEFWAILIELRPLSILLEVLLNFLFFMANVEVGFFYPMRKALLISAVATLSAMTAVMPVQAQETKTITIKSFEEKKERKLNFNRIATNK